MNRNGLIGILVSSVALLTMGACITHSLGTLPYVEMTPIAKTPTKRSFEKEIRCGSPIDPDGMYAEVDPFLKKSGIQSVKDFKLSLKTYPERGFLFMCIVLEGDAQ